MLRPFAHQKSRNIDSVIKDGDGDWKYQIQDWESPNNLVKLRHLSRIARNLRELCELLGWTCMSVARKRFKKYNIKARGTLL